MFVGGDEHKELEAKPYHFQRCDQCMSGRMAARPLDSGKNARGILATGFGARLVLAFFKHHVYTPTISLACLDVFPCFS